ncbi:MAG: ABC transporter substrate-binding protein [Polyangiaceae bacterium]
MRSIRTKTEAPCSEQSVRGGTGARRLAYAVLVAGTLTAACRGGVAPPLGTDRDVPPERGGTLRTAFFTDVRGLDAATAFDTAASALESLLYDGLVSYDDAGKIVPVLAERIDKSPDGKRYTFPLRRGVLFHDGTELTAADVKRSIERALHVKTPCPVPSYYERIVGYSAYHDGKVDSLEGVRIDGDYQVSFELTEPDATFLHVLALPTVAPVCKSAGRVWERGFAIAPCGAGPFKLKRYEGGQIIELVRHDGYWDKGKPYLDGVEWYLSMQSFTQRFKFERGDLDYIRELSEADSLLYRSSPAWKGRGEWEPSLTTGGTFMNTEMPPFDNRHVRRAVSFGIDREQVAAVRSGHVRAHAKMVPNVLIPPTPDYPMQRYDYARALEEMKLAGYEYDPKTGRGGYPREINYLAILDSYAQTAAEIYQQQLARIGIRIKIQVVGWPTFLAKTGRRKTAEMGFAGWHADFPDPSTFFEPILSTRSIQDEESQNAAFFSHAEFDGVLDRARRSSDAKERDSLYRRAEEIVVEEAPWATTYTYSYYELWQPYVKGYRPHPVLSQHVRHAYLDSGGKQREARLRSCGTGLAWLDRVACPRASARTTLALAGGRR